MSNVNIITAVPEERPSRTRAPEFKDRGVVIVELNRLIMKFNLTQSRDTGRATHTVPRFHMRGLRTVKNHTTGPKKILETVTGHRFALRRETAINEMCTYASPPGCQWGRRSSTTFWLCIALSQPNSSASNKPFTTRGMVTAAMAGTAGTPAGAMRGAKELVGLTGVPICSTDAGETATDATTTPTTSAPQPKS